MPPPGDQLFIRFATTLEDLDIAFSIKFLAEGGANAVYKIVDYDGSTGQPFFIHNRFERIIVPDYPNVLRLVKSNEKTLSTQEIVHGQETHILPLFTGYAGPNNDIKLDTVPMQHVVIAVDQVVLVHLDSQLQSQKNRRHTGSVLIPPEKLPWFVYGLLLEDMSTIPDFCITIEFKPKWLHLSPRQEPEKSYRCRTCAMRAFTEHDKGVSHNKVHFCPLDLVNGNVERIRPVISRFINRERVRSPINTDLHTSVLNTMTEVICKGPVHHLLAYLASLQDKFDPRDPSNTPISPTDSPEVKDQKMNNARLAYTLRDCSMYVRVRYNHAPPHDIDVSLADLDFKSPEKYRDWQHKERVLLEGGWYYGTERGASVFDPKEQCALARSKRGEESRMDLA